MPAAKLFVKKRKGMERMRATSVCRLAIKTGLLLAALAGCAVLAGAQRPPGARGDEETFRFRFVGPRAGNRDRKSTRLNSSHGYISYAVFCLKKKKHTSTVTDTSLTT